MDRHTLDKVEFDKVRELLSGHASCGLGRKMALKVKPTAHPELVRQWLRQVEEMIEAAAVHDLPPYGGVHDLREQVEKAVPPHLLEPEELAELAETLDATHRIVLWAEQLSADASALRAVCEQIGDFKAIADAIRKVISPAGEILDDASAKLRRIRTEIAQARVTIGQTIDRLLRQQSITRWLRYPNATFHEDRLVLPLSAEHRGRIPGIVHRSSDSGATLFVEPAEAVELNNRIISLKTDERAEINRLLWNLTHQVHLNQSGILTTLSQLAVLDLIVAKVRFARSFAMHCPHISEDARLKLNRARHPLLLQFQQEAAGRSERREVVPIDVRLGDDFDVLIITGPNTGGKTVALKTVALLCAMAQAGLPIPADMGSSVPIYRDILVDIGDEQSLQQSLSTFSSHVTRVIAVLRCARPGMLMLIDELGAGTDPEEGAAIGRAVVEELLHQHCHALVTTHLGVLKSLAYTEPRAENACVDFDEKSLRPTYRLLIGEPGNSNAINIAERLGLPEKVIEASRRHLDSSHQQLTRAIKGTLQSRRQAELARQQADAARAEAEQMKAQVLRDRQMLEAEQQRYRRWLEMIAALRPGDRVHVRRFDREGVIARMLLHKQLAVVAVGSVEMEVSIHELSKVDDTSLA